MQLQSSYNQPPLCICLSKPSRRWCCICIVTVRLGYSVTPTVSLWPPQWWCPPWAPVSDKDVWFSSIPNYNLFCLLPVIMVSLKLKKPLRPVAHKRQITANQKLNSESRQALRMRGDKQGHSRAKRFAISLMLMNLIQSILCKTSLWW